MSLSESEWSVPTSPTAKILEDYQVNNDENSNEENQKDNIKSNSINTGLLMEKKTLKIANPDIDVDFNLYHYLTLSIKYFNQILQSYFEIKNSRIWALFYYGYKYDYSILYYKSLQLIQMHVKSVQDLPNEVTAATAFLGNRYDIRILENLSLNILDKDIPIILHKKILCSKNTMVDIDLQLGSNYTENNMIIAIYNEDFLPIMQSIKVLSVKWYNYLLFYCGSIQWWFVIDNNKAVYYVNSTVGKLTQYLLKVLIMEKKFNYKLIIEEDPNKVLTRLNTSSIGLNSNLTMIGPSLIK